MEYRSLISILDLTNEEVDELHAAAELYLPRIEAGGFKDSTLKGTAAVLLFYEASTRTRASFELAGKMLGVDTINISTKGSAIEKGETVKDTALTLDAMDFNTIVMRHEAADAVALFARYFSRAVLNAGAGRGQHPTQALLDSLALRQKGKFKPGTRLAIVGDLKHSRVMRSSVQLYLLRGIHVTLVAPPQLMPDGWTGLRPEMWQDSAAEPDHGTLGTLSWSTDFDAVLPGQDVVMMLRMQRERMAGGLLTSIDEYSKLYGLFENRLKRIKPDGVIMHPGPVNRGVEIGEEAFADPRCVIASQVTFGLAVRCALMCWSMGKLDEAVAAMQSSAQAGE